MALSPDAITSLEAFEVIVPLPRPVAVGSAMVADRAYTVVRVRTADGHEGVGYTFSRGLPVATIVSRLLAPIVVGLDSTLVEEVRASCLRGYWPSAEHGTFTSAVSAVDLALWDLMAKRAEMPLAQLLGQLRPSVPVCAVVGYSYDDADAALTRELARAVEIGAKSVKLVVGANDPATDRRRLSLVRDTVGPDRLLAVDAFRSFRDVDDATRRVRLLTPFDLSFVEDPFPESLAQLSKELRSRTGVSIALGESLPGHRSIAGLVGVADILRLDALVIGGVREFMSAAGLASANGISISTHVHPEIHIQMAAALGNLFPGGLEYIHPANGVDSLHEIIDSPLQIVDGQALVPKGNGLGIEWNWPQIKRYTRV